MAGKNSINGELGGGYFSELADLATLEIPVLAVETSMSGGQNLHKRRILESPDLS
jgi:hypothetical protein